ncbi:MAG TPA: NADP-dependent oxidoreductase [Polyangiaceae bacterium]|nr:NADP-dependent oxidoreductase [Polyangiaceae bacterium]
MRALLYDRFGPPDVLHVAEIEAPHVTRGEVLVRVEAAALNPKDVLVRKGKFAWMSGRRFPKIPGYDFAGTVAAIGPRVHGFSRDEPVYGMINRWSAGACAEMVSVPADELAPKPRRLSMVEAAAVPLAALTALQALRDEARVSAGARVVINGASGGVGTFAVQIAKRLGAHVIAVCSRRNAALVSELGADDVCAYDERDVRELGGEVHVFFDVFGNQPYPKVKHLLSKRGRFVTTIPRPAAVARDVATRFTSRTARLVVVKSRARDLNLLRTWIDGGVLRPVVDRSLPLEQGVEAVEYLETRRARGKIVLTL